MGSFAKDDAGSSPPRMGLLKDLYDIAEFTAPLLQASSMILQSNTTAAVGGRDDAYFFLDSLAQLYVLSTEMLTLQTEYWMYMGDGSYVITNFSVPIPMWVTNVSKRASRSNPKSLLLP